MGDLLVASVMPRAAENAEKAAVATTVAVAVASTWQRLQSLRATLAAV